MSSRRTDIVDRILHSRAVHDDVAASLAPGLQYSMSSVPQRRRTEGPPHESSSAPDPKRHGVARALGLGLIAGAADDDPSAIGTYAAAGAKAGPALLWTAPVTFPMMFTVVYLSAKLGQVSGRGLFQAIRDFLPRWVLYVTLTGVMTGNTIEAAADLGAMAAAVNLFVPLAI